MFVLDTNVISELRRGKSNASPAVRRWAADQPSHTLFLSAITVLELELGIQMLERRVPSQGAALRVWMTDFAVHAKHGACVRCIACA